MPTHRNTPSRAEQLYREITQSPDPAATLRAMVESDPKATEDEHLEFKSYPKSYYLNRNSGYDRSNLIDKKNDFVHATWCEILSAFANTGGGVIVWGIEASKGEDGIDQAKRLSLYPNPTNLASRLKELHLSATDPPVIGVEILPIIADESSGDGFVVAYIPQGEHPPYRAEYPTKQYYMRAVDSCVVASRPMLQRLFYPTSESRLQIDLVIHLEGRGSRNSVMAPKCKIECLLKNNGTASSHDVYVLFFHNISVNAGSVGLYPSSGWTMRDKSRNTASFSTEHSIHPGMRTLIFTTDDFITDKHILLNDKILPEFDEFKLHFSVYSRDSQPRHFSRILRPSDLDSIDPIQLSCNELDKPGLNPSFQEKSP